MRRCHAAFEHLSSRFDHRCHGTATGERLDRAVVSLNLERHLVARRATDWRCLSTGMGWRLPDDREHAMRRVGATSWWRGHALGGATLWAHVLDRVRAEGRLDFWDEQSITQSGPPRGLAPELILGRVGAGVRPERDPLATRSYRAVREPLATPCEDCESPAERGSLRNQGDRTHSPQPPALKPACAISCAEQPLPRDTNHSLSVQLLSRRTRSLASPVRFWLAWRDCPWRPS